MYSVYRPSDGNKSLPVRTIMLICANTKPSKRNPVVINQLSFQPLHFWVFPVSMQQNTNREKHARKLTPIQDSNGYNTSILIALGCHSLHDYKATGLAFTLDTPVPMGNHTGKKKKNKQ